MRLKKLADAEAEGRSFWTPKLEDAARVKLFYAFNDATSNFGGYDGPPIAAIARAHTVRELGIVSLSNEQGIERDVGGMFQSGDEELIFSYLESLLATLDSMQQTGVHGWQVREDATKRLPALREIIKTILREHRVSFDLVGDQFVPFESRDMHESVVVPTLTLLGADKRFNDSEKAYRKAIQEIHDGAPDDAITDAGTALQTMLQALGCDGNSLGPLMKSAKAKGLLGPHDSPMTDAVGKMIDWVSSDRSEMGDAHNAKPARPEDAWFAVHVVGALMLRLAAGTRRK